jgi:hypothetical protein
MTEPVNITIDQTSTFGLLISSNILNAFYASLALEQASGADLTEELEQRKLAEIFERFVEIAALVEAIPMKSRNP